MSSIITLLTDFGVGDGYVACIKGVILSLNPNAVVVDISHSIEPQNVMQAGFILGTVHHYFPEGTIHIVIVDPGVGSPRKAIIVKTNTACFLAPDNGVLSYVITEKCPQTAVSAIPVLSGFQSQTITGGLEAVVITNKTFWRQQVSSTFHGRDIFAPVAAHLSMGVPMHQFGESIDSVRVLSILQPYRDLQGNLIGHILHIDTFGNLVTDIKISEFPSSEIIVEIGKRRIYGLRQFYAETVGLAIIMGSSGYLEIALTNGNAAAFLKAKVGDEVKLLVEGK
jgi:S-adenosyl-L-methionine hydrolase (adenosine-forming)